MPKNKIQKEINENRICSMVGSQLMKHYPNWEWYVECRLETGVVSVRNQSLDGDYGFYIPLKSLLNETDPTLVMRAGGEILERYRVHQDASKQYDIKRDFTGAAVGDMS